jgi:hypothetical protein
MRNSDSFGLSLIMLLVVAGCGSNHGVRPASITKPGDIDEIPLLVRFEGEPLCPKDVVELVAAECSPANQPKKGAGDVCRSRNRPVIWIGVQGTAPYDLVQTPNFEVNPKPNNVKPIEKPGGGNCKGSADGILSCKIKSNAHSGEEFDYSVDVAGCASLDPRILVN